VIPMIFNKTAVSIQIRVMQNLSSGGMGVSEFHMVRMHGNHVLPVSWMINQS
jgi:hypothetical protein